ncbi:MAG: hypothetical protein ACO1RX_04810 [Candidatus Sericytochromatia bacterium]
MRRLFALALVASLLVACLPSTGTPGTTPTPSPSPSASPSPATAG